MSNWKNRPYDFYLIFGQTDKSQAPWIKSSWKTNFESYFNQLIKQTEFANSETGNRIVKYKPVKTISKTGEEKILYSKLIKPGRLSWNEKSHNLWTCEPNSKNLFSHACFWTPRWTICKKIDLPPDIFISISNQDYPSNKKTIQFGYFIVVAIAQDVKIDAKPILKELSEKINAKTTVLMARKWGEPVKSGDWKFINGIQDTITYGIYKKDSLHNYDFDELKFEPVWEVIYREK